MILKQFLTAETMLLRKAKMKHFGGYCSLSEFVLINGRSFDLACAFAKSYGPMKACFANAQALALNGRKRFTYCEGYAIGIIPVAHAWLLSRNGNIIETTWPEVGSDYYGIAFSTEYLRKRVLATKSYHSLIDDWRNDWPLLNTDPKEWRHV